MVHQPAWEFGPGSCKDCLKRSFAFYNPNGFRFPGKQIQETPVVGVKKQWFPAKNPLNHMDVNGIGNRPTYFPKLYHSNTELSIWLNNESQFTNNHIQE
jgi:hypothetical protein